jgi:hypothetical protein
MIKIDYVKIFIMSDNDTITPGKSELCNQYFSIMSVIAFGSYYLYAYLKIPNNLTDESGNDINDNLKLWFLIYVVTYWSSMIKSFVTIRHIKNYWGIPMNKELFEKLNPCNRFPFILIKWSDLLNLGIAIYFCTIFIPFSDGCDIYEDHYHPCTALRMISVITMIVLSFIAFILGILILWLLWECLKSPADGCAMCGALCYFMCCHRDENENANQNQVRDSNPVASFIGRQMNNYLPISAKPPADGTCAICMLDAEKGDQWKELPCKHKFHPICIDGWFITQNNTGHTPSCPMCRQIVTLV